MEEIDSRMKSHQGRSRTTERTSSIGNLFFIHPLRNRYRNIFGCISFGNEPNWQLESKSSKSLYKDVSYKMYRKVLKKKKKKPKTKPIQTIQQKESKDIVKPQLTGPAPVPEGGSGIWTTRSEHEIHYTIYRTV